MPYSATSYLRKPISLVFGLCIAATLSFATSPASASYQGPGLYSQAIGSKITLKQDIEVPEGVRIHFQNGRVLPFKEIVQLEPYCYFYSTRGKDKLKDPFRITQAQFVVKDVVRRPETVQSSHVQVASLGRSFFNNGGVQYTLTTRFQINDVLQPDVDSLICAVWADRRDRGYVTYEEIVTTLGTIASMELTSSQ